MDEGLSRKLGRTSRRLGRTGTTLPSLTHGQPLTIIAEGDLVDVHFSTEATHSGEVDGFAPTGKRHEFRGMALCRLENCKLVEDEVNYHNVQEVLRRAAEGAGASA